MNNINNALDNNSQKYFSLISNMDPVQKTDLCALGKDGGNFFQDYSKDASDGLTSYLNEIRKSPLLSADEEVYYARLAKKGDVAATKKIIECNLRLVVYVVKKFNNKGMPLIDLIQEGNLGLLKSVSKFDPELGCRFSTYAFWWIKQNIQQALMNKSRLIRLPIYVIKILNKCRKAKYQLTKNMNINASNEQLAKSINVSVKTVKKINILNESSVSLDVPISIKDSIEINDVMALQKFDPYMSIENEQNTIDFYQWIKKLSEQQAEIITRRFGLQGSKAETLKEVGLAVDMSSENVRRIQITALNKLRELMEQQGIHKEDLLHAD